MTLLLSLPLFSDSLLDTLNGKSFLSLGLVQQSANQYGNSQALNLSYSFTHQNKLGLEVGYVQSLDDAKHKTLTKETDFSSISLLSTYLIPFDSHIALKGKVGYAKNKNAEDGLSYGAEFIFQITQKSGLNISYQQMNNDMKYIMINSVYRLKH
jgi:hypothetical protein